MRRANTSFGFSPGANALRAITGSLLLAGICMMCVSCSGGASGESGAGSTTVKMVATTGHIHDALARITRGTDTEIKLFCGPGIDPHSYSASTKDVKAMENADLIIYNGFHLEARLHDLLEERYAKKSWSMASAFPRRERLDWMTDGKVDPETPVDPHIWNHLPGWAECVTGLAEHLAELYPDNSEKYLRNAEQYVEEINSAHISAKTTLGGIPRDRRFLVTAHDAFNYFAKNYNLETVAVLGVGNDAEADIRTMSAVV